MHQIRKSYSAKVLNIRCLEVFSRISLIKLYEVMKLLFLPKGGGGGHKKYSPDPFGIRLTKFSRDYPLVVNRP